MTEEEEGEKERTSWGMMGGAGIKEEGRMRWRKRWKRRVIYAFGSNYQRCGQVRTFLSNGFIGIENYLSSIEHVSILLTVKAELCRGARRWLVPKPENFPFSV